MEAKSAQAFDPGQPNADRDGSSVAAQPSNALRQRTAGARGGGMESTLNAPVTPHYTFKVGDMAVHPSHGVGEVERMEDRDFGGKKTACYVIKIRDTGLKVMI